MSLSVRQPREPCGRTTPSRIKLILRSATSIPADYLGLGNEIGGISVGRIADLILLNDDPLTDIGNVQQIEAVIFGGRVHDRPNLDDMLRRVEVAAATGFDSESDSLESYLIR